MEGIKIMANGEFEGHMSQDEFIGMIMGNEDEDCDYVRDE